MATKPDKQAQIIFYPTPPTSEVTSQATSHNPSQAPSPSAPINMHYYLTEGLQEAEHRVYKDNHSFAGAVKSQTTLAEAGSGGKYVVFSSVSEEQLTKIDKLRDDRYPSLRFMYLEDQQTLIVKIIASPLHEVVHREFEKILWAKITPMGLLRDLAGMGSARYKGIAIKKEPDSCYKPRSRAGAASWPTLAIECGVSERIGRLRVDANWWLTNSSGKVNIVVLFSVNKADRTILIEQWERESLPNRCSEGTTPSERTTPSEHTTPSECTTPSERTTPSATLKGPKCVHTITIAAPNNNEPNNNQPNSNDPDNDKPDNDEPNNDEPSGDEPSNEEPDNSKHILTLEFKKVFDRDAVKDTVEANIEFTALDLSQWAADIWHHGG